MLEKTGTVLEKFQTVSVGEPKGIDRHKHAFIGTVDDVLEDRGTVMVSDNCNEVWEVEADNVEVRD